MNTTIEQLQEVFRSTFEKPDLEISPELTAEQVDGWDSISHLDLIVNTEQAFGIEISGFDVMGLENVGDLINLVNKKLEAKQS